MIKLVLAIETSCDDTSVALVDQTGYVLRVVSATVDLDHEPYGGIVPEIASRNHTLHLLPLIDKILNETHKTWSDIDGIAVTNRPGLIGALIVGLVTAKSLSQIYQKPMIGVNHLEGHLVAPFLSDDKYKPNFKISETCITLAISGGHTSLYYVSDFAKYKVLGTTRDDAAGEAFDKFAKMLGLGFPGGVRVDQLSKHGNANAYNFPRSMMNSDDYMMSFSGLKSSAQRMLDSLSAEEKESKKSDLCASYQEAIVDVLLSKVDLAVKEFKCPRVCLTGGVSANSRLRERAELWALKSKVQLLIPPLKYCTDNAAMIGYAGLLRLQAGERHGLDLGPSPQSLEGDFQ